MARTMQILAWHNKPLDAPIDLCQQDSDNSLKDRAFSTSSTNRETDAATSHCMMSYRATIPTSQSKYASKITKGANEESNSVNTDTTGPPCAISVVRVKGKRGRKPIIKSSSSVLREEQYPILNDQPIEISSSEEISNINSQIAAQQPKDQIKPSKKKDKKEITKSLEPVLSQTVQNLEKETNEAFSLQRKRKRSLGTSSYQVNDDTVLNDTQMTESSSDSKKSKRNYPSLSLRRGRSKKIQGKPQQQLPNEANIYSAIEPSQNVIRKVFPGKNTDNFSITICSNVQTSSYQHERINEQIQSKSDISDKCTLNQNIVEENVKTPSRPSAKKRRILSEEHCGTESSPLSEQRVPVSKIINKRKPATLPNTSVSSKTLSYVEPVNNNAIITNLGSTHNISDYNETSTEQIVPIAKQITRKKKMMQANKKKSVITNEVAENNSAVSDSVVNNCISEIMYEASTPSNLILTLDKPKKEDKVKRTGKSRKNNIPPKKAISNRKTKWKNPNPPAKITIRIKPIVNVPAPLEENVTKISTNEKEIKIQPQTSTGAIDISTPIKSPKKRTKCAKSTKSKAAETSINGNTDINVKDNNGTLIRNITVSAPSIDSKPKLLTSPTTFSHDKPKLQLNPLTHLVSPVMSPKKTSCKSKYPKKCVETSSESSLGTLHTVDLEKMDLNSNSTSHSWANISTTTNSSIMPLDGRVPRVRLVRLAEKDFSTTPATNTTLSTSSSSSSSCSSSSTSQQSSSHYSDLVKDTNLDLSASSTTTDPNIFLIYMQQHAQRLLGLPDKFFRKKENDAESNGLNDRLAHQLAMPPLKISFSSGKRCVDINQNDKVKFGDSAGNKDIGRTKTETNTYVKSVDKVITGEAENKITEISQYNHISEDTLIESSSIDMHIFKSPPLRNYSLKSSTKVSNQSSLQRKESTDQTSILSNSQSSLDSTQTLLLPSVSKDSRTVKSSLKTIAELKEVYQKSIDKREDSDDDVLSILHTDTFSDSEDEDKSLRKVRSRDKFVCEKKLLVPSQRKTLETMCEKKTADSTSALVIETPNIVPPEDSETQNSPMNEGQIKPIPTLISPPKLMFADPTIKAYYFLSICKFQQKCNKSSEQCSHIHLPKQSHFNKVDKFLSEAHTRHIIVNYVTMREVLFGSPYFLQYAQLFMKHCIEKNLARFLVEILMDIHAYQGTNFDLLEIGVEGLNRDGMRVNCADLFALPDKKDGRPFLHVLLFVAGRSRITHTSIVHTLLKLAKDMRERIDFRTAVLLLRKSVELLDSYHIESTYNLIVNNTTEEIFGEVNLLEKYMHQLEQCSKFNAKLSGYIEDIKCRIEDWKKKFGNSAPSREDRGQNHAVEAQDQSWATNNERQWMSQQSYKQPNKRHADHRYRVSPDTTQYLENRNQISRPLCVQNMPAPRPLMWTGRMPEVWNNLRGAPRYARPPPRFGAPAWKPNMYHQYKRY